MYRATTIALAVAAGFALTGSAGAATVCPAAGAATAGCNLIITVTNAGTTVANGPSQGAADPSGTYDGSDDTLIGIVNNSTSTLNSLFLSSPFHANGGIMGFDGDGIDTYTFPSHPPGFGNSDPGGYGGPLSFFTNIAGNKQSGTVNFFGGLAPGASTYFSLEEAIPLQGLVVGAPEPSTWAMMLLGFVGLGFAFRQSRRKASFA